MDTAHAESTARVDATAAIAPGAIIDARLFGQGWSVGGSNLPPPVVSLETEGSSVQSEPRAGDYASRKVVSIATQLSGSNLPLVAKP